MIAKIKLTHEGDIVTSSSRDEEELSVWQHRFCNGFADIRQPTKTHQTIACRRCHFRFVFTLEVNTIGKFKKYCRKLLRCKHRD